MSTTLRAIPRPMGQTREQFYDWARGLCKWFAAWYSAGIIHSAGYAMQSTPLWSASLSMGAESAAFNAQYWVLRTYYNQTAYASAARPLWLCLVGDGNTSYGNLFSIQRGHQVYTNDAIAQTETLFATGAQGVLSACIVKVGVLATTMRLLGPGGLFMSTNVSLS